MFLECSGNSGARWTKGPATGTAQTLHGLTSTSDWTRRTGLDADERGRRPSRRNLGARRRRGRAVMTRSVPIEKLLDDALIAYGQNGEALRPEQGYPARLLLPGLGRQHQRQVAAPPEVRRPAIRDARGNVEVHRSDARQLGAPVHVRHGGQVDDHLADRAIESCPGAVRGRFAASPGPAVDASRASRSARTVVRPGRTRSSMDPVLPIAHTRFVFPWTWDGSGGNPDQPRDRRNRLCAADAERAGRRARHRLDLSLQRPAELAGGELMAQSQLYATNGLRSGAACGRLADAARRSDGVQARCIFARGLVLVLVLSLQDHWYCSLTGKQHSNNCRHPPQHHNPRVPGTFGYGHSATAQEIAADQYRCPTGWCGLPPGSGTAAEGCNDLHAEVLTVPRC